MVKFLENSTFQRLAYSVLILLWILMNFYNNRYLLELEHPSFGISFLWVFMVPAIILLIQIIFNSYTGWLVSCVVYLIFILYIGKCIFTDLITSPQHAYTIVDYSLLVFVLGITAAIGLILIKLRKIKTLF